jgi:uncharacterized spore protein YtfJ
VAGTAGIGGGDEDADDEDEDDDGAGGGGGGGTNRIRRATTVAILYCSNVYVLVSLLPGIANAIASVDFHA